MSKTVAAAAASTSTSAPASAPVRVCVVTGLSGAGKSTALKVFEDMGHFVVDGLPASLAPEMAAMMSRPCPRTKITGKASGRLTIYVTAGGAVIHADFRFCKKARRGAVKQTRIEPAPVI